MNSTMDGQRNKVGGSRQCFLLSLVPHLFSSRLVFLLSVMKLEDLRIHKLLARYHRQKNNFGSVCSRPNEKSRMLHPLDDPPLSECPCTIHPLLGGGGGTLRKGWSYHVYITNQFQTAFVPLGSGWLCVWLRLWCDSLGRSFKGHRPAVIDAVHTSGWDGMSEVWVSPGGPQGVRANSSEASSWLIHPAVCGSGFGIGKERKGRRDVSSPRHIVKSTELRDFPFGDTSS